MLFAAIIFFVILVLGVMEVNFYLQFSNNIVSSHKGSITQDIGIAESHVIKGVRVIDFFGFIGSMGKITKTPIIRNYKDTHN